MDVSGDFTDHPDPTVALTIVVAIFSGLRELACHLLYYQAAERSTPQQGGSASRIHPHPAIRT
ncbi:hypothetical protein [Sphingomonas sp. CLY1604]|uniref:hypothetical protein n=1 Tax=Sphingomonas sp. CLY1604 TaxID=3457786 RepID=UPI003FD73BE4